MKPILHISLFAALLTSLPTHSVAQDHPPAVERFFEPGVGSVNSYIIDAPDGLIIIDFQRDTASAAKAIALVKGRGRPVVALLVTHAHPDHIGGLQQFRRAFPAAPVYASAETAAEIASDSLGFQKLARSALGPLAPDAYPVPDRMLESGSALMLAGLRIEPLEMGAGESISTTVFYLPETRALFAADIVIDGMTDFLMEGRTGLWLRQIERLKQTFPSAERLYPGHGAEGEADRLVAGQRTFLMAVRSAVEARLEGGKLSPAAQTAILADLARQFGDRPPVAEIPEMERLNLDAVARELAPDNAP